MMKRFILLASIAICLAQVPTADVAAAKTGSKQAAEKEKNGSAAKAADDKAHANWKLGDDCASSGDFKDELKPLKKHGPPIVYGSNFIPAGGTTDFGLAKTFDESLIYFSFIKQKGDKPGKALGRSNTASRAATDKDNLVTKDLLKKGETIVSVNVPESVADRWKEADIYLYTCNKSPENISQVSVRISPLTESIALTAFVMVIAYFLASRTKAGQNGVSFFQTLNPVRITAGADGRGSLNKFQVFFFSTIVFVLIVYFLFRTGLLSDISTTILALLGIAGVGSTAAKGAALSNGLGRDNEAYLRGKGWYDGKPTVTPRFYDLFLNEAEFDVYRYQCFIFSGVVGCALLVGGVTQLSSFTIPESLLGILGLSQAVYVGGKLVTRTSASKLDPLVDQMRETEGKAHSGAAAPGPGGPGPDADPGPAAAAAAPQTASDDYRNKARAASALFKNITGLDVDEKKLV